METENGMLDCMVTMRRYILKSTQSAWAKSSRRVVIWSPCLSLPLSKKGELIPALRHCPKQNHQDVRFVSTNDIERDSCTVYIREKVETLSRPKNAHGVATKDSVPGHAFTYKRGDKFWLHIKQQQKPDDIGIVSAPVINLRTYETGTIFTQHVCWYPVARGPLGELWTFGGLEKTVRGVKKQNWIWSVVQSDGPKTTVCDMVQVAPNCDIQYAERMCLFKARLKFMEGLLNEGSSSTGNKVLIRSYLEILNGSRRQISPTDAIRRILKSLIPISSIELPPTPAASCFSPSSSTMGQYQTAPPPAKRRRLSFLANNAPDTETRLSDPLLKPLQPDRRPTIAYITNPQLPKIQLPNADEVSNVLWSLYSSKPLDKPFMAADEIAHDPPLIRQAHDRARKILLSDQLCGCGAIYCPRKLESEKHIADEKAKLRKYCSKKDPDCIHTALMPPQTRRPHYHLLPSKCTFNRAGPESTHIHCVGERNLPGRIGGCVFRKRYTTKETQSKRDEQAGEINYLKSPACLIPRGKQHHNCCEWSPEDRAKSGYDEEVKKEREYVHPSLREVEVRDNEKLTGANGTEVENSKRVWKPRTFDRRPFTKAPELTEGEVEGQIKDSRLLSELHAKAKASEEAKEKAKEMAREKAKERAEEKAKADEIAKAKIREGNLLLDFTRLGRERKLAKVVMEKQGLLREMEERGHKRALEEAAQTQALLRRGGELLQTGVPTSQGNGVSNVFGDFPAGFHCITKYDAPTSEYPKPAPTSDAGDSWYASRSDEVSLGAGNILPVPAPVPMMGNYSGVSASMPPPGFNNMASGSQHGTMVNRMMINNTTFNNTPSAWMPIPMPVHPTEIRSLPWEATSSRGNSLHYDYNEMSLYDISKAAEEARNRFG